MVNIIVIVWACCKMFILITRCKMYQCEALLDDDQFPTLLSPLHRRHLIHHSGHVAASSGAPDTADTHPSQHTRHQHANPVSLSSVCQAWTLSRVLKTLFNSFINFVELKVSPGWSLDIENNCFSWLWWLITLDFIAEVPAHNNYLVYVHTQSIIRQTLDLLTTAIGGLQSF